MSKLKLKLLENDIGVLPDSGLGDGFLNIRLKQNGKSIQEQLNWNAEIVCFDKCYQENGKTAHKMRDVDIFWQEAHSQNTWKTLTTQNKGK